MTQVTARRAIIPNEEVVQKLRMFLGGGVWDPELAKKSTSLLIIDV